MKSNEELNEIKEEYEGLNKKLSELTEDELKQVAGGIIVPVYKVEPWIREYIDNLNDETPKNLMED